MRRIFLLNLLISISYCCFAQNNMDKTDDAGRIAIAPYVDPNLGFSKAVATQLKNKLNAILTKQGIAGTKGQRFIITATADVISEDIIVTTEEMYQYQLEIHFIVGDGLEGTMFATTSQVVKGIGETKAAAYLQAIRRIKTDDSKFQQLLSVSKDKILEYYNSKCDFIITEAKSFAEKQDYDVAIFNLMSVPDVCKECYDKCMSAVAPIYKAKIDEEGARFFAEASSIWAAGQDVNSAREAGEKLSQINPSSTYYKQAVSLSDEISSRVKELDQREWDFKLKQQQDLIDVEKANIEAMRQIGVAYGENQQITYNVTAWLF